MATQRTTSSERTIHPTRRRRQAVAFVVALALVGAACGSDSDTSADSESSFSQTTNAPSDRDGQSSGVDRQRRWRRRRSGIQRHLNSRRRGTGRCDDDAEHRQRGTLRHTTESMRTNPLRRLRRLTVDSPTTAFARLSRRIVIRCPHSPSTSTPVRTPLLAAISMRASFRRVNRCGSRNMSTRSTMTTRHLEMVSTLSLTAHLRRSMTMRGSYGSVYRQKRSTTVIVPTWPSPSSSTHQGRWTPLTALGW